MSYDLSKLQCVKHNPDSSISAACPVCRAQGSDKTGNHLKIFKNGAFNCIVGSDGDPQHNRLIRQYLKGDGDDIVFIDPEPKLTVEKIYPEDTLSRLVPDYSYWIGRGMRVDVLKRLENGIAPIGEKSKLSGRSLFPLRNMDGLIAGFSGRLVEENSFAPKWKHLAKISRLTYPWNVTGEAIRRRKVAVLTESIGDLLACLSHGIEPTLCIFGLNLNGLIISNMISANVKTVVVSLNRDEDASKGQAAAQRIREKLSNFWADENIVIRLPNGHKDWGKAAEGGEAGAAELAAFKKEIDAL